MRGLAGVALIAAGGTGGLVIAIADVTPLAAGTAGANLAPPLRAKLGAR